MSKKLTLDDIQIDNSQDALIGNINIDNGDKKAEIGKMKDKEPIKYKPIRKDFIKVDRWVLDLVVPFLNSNSSPGVSILYLDLFRMSYGYGKNTIKLTDEILEQRIAIPKRTIMKYKKELIKYDLLSYKAGNRKTRGEFTIILPEQSAYFKEHIHKKVRTPTDDVGITEGNITIYNKDKFIDSETLVFSFYKTCGWKETSITRENVNKGIKIVIGLMNQGYSLKFIDGLCKFTISYCKQNNKPIYGIGFITHLLNEYLDKIERQKRSAAVKSKKDDEIKELNEQLQKEEMLLVKYQQMPKPLRSLVMTEAKAMSEDVIDKTNIKITSDTTQKYILDSCLIEIMERDYSGNN
tara:strand:- start:6175 stop:7227 length:1053 start_codon:yes stop_codon:yes gene_type:complete